MPTLSLADEIAEVRLQIARLKHREASLRAMAAALPAIPVFRKGWPITRTAQLAQLSHFMATPVGA